MSGARILIADDYLAGGEALADLLREEGYVVATVDPASSALDCLEAFDPHVALLSTERPDEPALALIARVRESVPRCAVISLASSGDVDFARAALAAGAAAYLLKPLHFSHLLIALGIFGSPLSSHQLGTRH